MRRFKFLGDINHLLISLSFFLVSSLPQAYLNVRGHVRAKVTLAGGPGRLIAVVIVMVTAQIH
ncbi:hypothetical protein N9U55_02340 [Luminiphilus sp.]|nr:hypothetical protein [Luminiphilus sp.]MDA9722104.1 hypothetical protein [Luminiphilus sp.]